MYDKNLEKVLSNCEERGYFEIDGNKTIQEKIKILHYDASS